MEISVASVTVSVVASWWVWRNLKWVWLKPKMLESYLRRQGLAGIPYTPLVGDLKRNFTMMMEARSKPIKVTDDITSRVLPYSSKMLKTHGMLPCWPLDISLFRKAHHTSFSKSFHPWIYVIKKTNLSGLDTRPLELESWSFSSPIYWRCEPCCVIFCVFCLRSYLPTKGNRRMKAAAREIQVILRGIINKRKKAREAGKAPNDDLLGILLESNLGQAKGNGRSTEDVMEECKLFYFAGQETTSVLLVWTMVLLSHHQDPISSGYIFQ